MKKTIALLLILHACNLSIVQAQKYFTRMGKVDFFSKAPLETIEAHNEKATSVVDLATGKIQFAVLIKAFQFEKALMQEHFNENYLESDQYPKASFRGQIQDWPAFDWTKSGTYPIQVMGTMTLHGVQQEIELPATFYVQDGKMAAQASFELLLADYEIAIPKIVRDNIAKTVRISVAVDYEAFDKP
ncbi:MAG: YceI family protein [Bacteroidota bacterium]